MSIRSQVKQVLTEQQNKKYEKCLHAKQVTYGEWIGRRETSVHEAARKMDYAAREAGDAGLEDAAEETQLVCLVFAEGWPAGGTPGICRTYLSRNPDWVMAYGDEDLWECGESEPCRPWFKPDWSPDLFDCCFYFGSFVIFRKSFYEYVTDRIGEIPAAGRGRKDQAGLEQAGTEQGDKQHTDMMHTDTLYTDTTYTDTMYIDTLYLVYCGEVIAWMRKCTALAGGYGKRTGTIGHIPEILYHCRSEEERKYFWRTETADNKAGDGAGENGTEGNKAGNGTVELETKAKPRISVVIPSKDNPQLLEKCIRAVIRSRGSSRMPYEFLIVDNGSKDENRQCIEAFVKKCREEYGEAFMTYLYHPMEFDFSGMCNLGAQKAGGELLLFLNDDVELACEGTLEKMAESAVRDYTGAVGIKLYYPDSDRIQHAGITNLPMGPVHKLQFLPDDTSYYFDSNRGRRNVLAVTAACLMIEKSKFEAVGGFSGELKVAFNDVDLCFSLYEQGYHNVCRNDLYAFHHESLSRGDDEAPEKLRRLLRERDTLYARHLPLAGKDPYYPEGLGREGLDTRIRPAYETAGNRLQGTEGKWKKLSLADYRKDPCLLIRVEQILEQTVYGYGVILGDNNACYERKLLLIPAEEGRKGQNCGEEREACSGTGGKEPVIVYAAEIEGQYRPDLVENMPDQQNTGLAGFWIRVDVPEDLREGLPAGTYAVGMAVKNRVTGLRIWNVSSRTVEV